jgi:transposase
MDHHKNQQQNQILKSTYLCTVATWSKKWEKHGEQSLHDQPRSGRPSILNATEKELAKQYMKEEPRSLKHVVERFAQKTAKRLSISS